MSFSFFKASRPKTPQEVVKEIKDSLMALDTTTVVEVKVLDKALEEVEKNFVTLRCMLCGDGEVEPTMDQVLRLALEVCKEDVLALMILKLPYLGWEARKDLVHCWSILLKQKVDSRYCYVEYVENHFEFLDFLVVWIPFGTSELSYNEALHSGSSVLESLDDFAEGFRSQLAKSYDFASWLAILTTLIQDSSKNIQIAAFHIFKVFVANPSKPREVKMILAKIHEKLLELLHNLSAGKGNNAFELQPSAVVPDTQIGEEISFGIMFIETLLIFEIPSVKIDDILSSSGTEDEQFEVEKELIIKEIDKLSRRSNLDP